MTFQFEIPTISGAAISYSLQEGDTLFVFGANGTGKSALLQRLFAVHVQRARRMSGHRQVWFEPHALSLSPVQKQTTESNARQSDVSADSRWREHYAPERAGIALFDLVEAENRFAREITGAVQTNNIELAQSLAQQRTPLQSLNELLRLANMPIQISIGGDAQLHARRSGGEPYQIALLSDGERNALLIVATALTVPAGTLLVVDEPERHLHRAIISPLLTQLFAKRRDCAFIISTHEVGLLLDNESAKALLLRDCKFQHGQAVAWAADLVTDPSSLDEDIRRDLLGARAKALFIEGTEQSLDKPLYSLIFPEISIVAKSDWHSVFRAVEGIRSSEQLHWVRAWGIVDDDRRSVESIANLKSRGIYALAVYSVESIYYHAEIRRRVASRMAGVIGTSADDLLEKAKTAALGDLQTHVQRLSVRSVVNSVRSKIQGSLPKKEEIESEQPINISINVANALSDERTRLQAAIDQLDLDTIICRYPVRETGALAKIAKALGFQDRDQYENAVRKLLADDNDALVFVRTLFGDLPEEIARP